MLTRSLQKISYPMLNTVNYIVWVILVNYVNQITSVIQVLDGRLTWVVYLQTIAYGMYNSIQFCSVEDKSIALNILYILSTWKIMLLQLLLFLRQIGYL